MVYVQFSDATKTAVIAVFGCQQDSTAYQNQGTILDTDPRYVAFINPNSVLANAQNDAYSKIDMAAGQTRLKYVTDVPGQEMTYQLKAQDAANYKQMNYPSANIVSYPWVQGYAMALYGSAPTAAQYQSAADGILTMQAQWIAKGAQIEQARMAGKTAVGACTAVNPNSLTLAEQAAIITAQNNAMTALQAL